jgi:small subunit ribosomal protein S4
MGDVRRKHNLYSRPKKMFNSARIAEENDTKTKYGLKNKTEIWKISAKVKGLRFKAKKFISKSEKEKQEFFGRLNYMGLEVKVISDVLALKNEDLLNRRLQTVVFNKGLAKTILEARQLIVHKNVFVDGRIVNIPSFAVNREDENKISLKERKEKNKGEIKNE